MLQDAILQPASPLNCFRICISSYGDDKLVYSIYHITRAFSMGVIFVVFMRFNVTFLNLQSYKTFADFLKLWKRFYYYSTQTKKHKMFPLFVRKKYR